MCRYMKKYSRLSAVDAIVTHSCTQYAHQRTFLLIALLACGKTHMQISISLKLDQP